MSSKAADNSKSLGGSTEKSNESSRAGKLEKAADYVSKGDYWMSPEENHSNPIVRYTHASRMYVSAAELYRSLLMWRQAGESYVKAASAEKSKACVLASATLSADAAELFERVDTSEALNLYRSSSEVFAGLGKYFTSANLMVQAAELQLSENAKLAAADSFSSAANLYLAEDKHSLAVSALHSAGSILVHEDAYMEAYSLFERAARVSLDDNLARWHAPRLTLNAGLCMAAAFFLPDQQDNETLKLKERFENYHTLAAKRDPKFGAGRERRFLLNVVDCATSWAVNDLIDHIWNYDHVCELHPHELQALQFIYEAVKVGPPPGSVRPKMAEADMKHSKQIVEYVNEEKEIWVQMTHAEMLRSGLLKQLEDEKEKDQIEALEDAKREYYLKHGITEEEKKKRERERDQV